MPTSASGCWRCATVDGDEMFLANYADVLTDLPLPTMIDNLGASDKTARSVGPPIVLRPTWSARASKTARP